MPAAGLVQIEGPGAAVALGDAAFDGRLKIDDTGEGASLPAATREQEEETSDGHEAEVGVKVDGEVVDEPGTHLRVFVASVIVKHYVDHLARRDGSLDSVEEAIGPTGRRWRCMRRPSTVPSRTSRAADSVVAPWRLSSCVCAAGYPVPRGHLGRVRFRTLARLLSSMNSTSAGAGGFKSRSTRSVTFAEGQVVRMLERTHPVRLPAVRLSDPLRGAPDLVSNHVRRLRTGQYKHIGHRPCEMRWGAGWAGLVASWALKPFSVKRCGPRQTARRPTPAC